MNTKTIYAHENGFKCARVLTYGFALRDVDQLLQRVNTPKKIKKIFFFFQNDET